MSAASPRYLFIRILEACNAGCSMCGFAWSKDTYRLEPAELNKILRVAKQAGIRCVRFTGGEPLVHRAIVELVDLVSSYGIRSSIITNGALLSRKLPRLVEAGLDHVVVSIDGAHANTHDRIRDVPGLFEAAMDGLRNALASHVRCRVNTVCGPNNFREMPDLQDLLTDLGVHQWELSSLKLERRLDYSDADVVDLDQVVEHVYIEAQGKGRLVPMGKVWCGITTAERALYLETGITPRPDRRCHVVHRVRYYDAHNGLLFPCSLLPHRPDARTTCTRITDLSEFVLNSPQMIDVVNRFHADGPSVCTGCSTTAAGYSNSLDRGDAEEEWAY